MISDGRGLSSIVLIVKRELSNCVTVTMATTLHLLLMVEVHLQLNVVKSKFGFNNMKC